MGYFITKERWKILFPSAAGSRNFAVNKKYQKYLKINIKIKITKNKDKIPGSKDVGLRRALAFYSGLVSLSGYPVASMALSPVSPL